MHRLVGALFVSVFAASGGAQSRAPDVTDATILGHVRAAIKDSLSGGGLRADELLFAGDSLSRLVLQGAGPPVRTLDNALEIACPGSTDSTGAPVAGPVGYRVSVGLLARPDSASYVLGVSKSCRFVHRGAAPRLNGGFTEGMSWELHRERGVWRVGRRLSHVIT